MPDLDLADTTMCIGHLPMVAVLDVDEAQAVRSQNSSRFFLLATA